MSVLDFEEMASHPWKKRGMVFSPSDGPAWMATHAQVPTPLLCSGVIRVYFSSRPVPNISLTSFVDLDIEDPTKIVTVNAKPILELGKPGTFDEHGIMPSCAVRHGELVYLYYSGWQRGVSVPYTNCTGLAISEDGGATFTKVSSGPILSKGRFDPYSATSPFVTHDENGWHMWYCSGTNWLQIGSKQEHTYDIKYAYSEDGIRWDQTGLIAVPQCRLDEAVTRPWVVRDDNRWYMWFCFRGSMDFRDGGDSYDIGLATSTDAINWSRCERFSGIYRSLDSWDSLSLAYPAVLRGERNLLMFYNGNCFGRDGFGLAEYSN
jgi:predicted GH43/DUF377 family glycosyl hydrolase